MTLILPDPLAIGASELNHVKTIAINTIYQNLSVIDVPFLENLESMALFYSFGVIIVARVTV